MGNRLEGKKAIVTGGGSGIGRGTAIRFAEEGADVFIADLIPESLEGTAGEVRKLGRKAFTCPVDVSDEAQVERMVAQTGRDLGNIDILFHAAGVLHSRYRSGADPSPIKFENMIEMDYAAFQKVLAINLGGTYLVDRAVARVMVKAGKGGRIINIASRNAKFPIRGMVGYNVSKAGVWMLTRTLALELGPHNITVNAIAPGYIKTPMTWGAEALSDTRAQNTGVPLGRWGEPRDVANAALFLASDDGAYFTAEVLNVDGGCIEGF